MRTIPTISTIYPSKYGQFSPQRTPQQFFAVPFWEKMGKVKFELRSPDAKRETAINVYYYFDNKRFVSSTRRKIHPSEWNDRTMRPKKSYPSYHSLTTYLDKIETAIRDRHNYLLAFGQYPTEEHFKDAVQTLSGKLRMDRPTLREHLDRLCAQAEKRSNYHKVRTQLDRYLKASRASVDFDAINKNWFDDFQYWLLENNEAESYAYRLTKQFRTVIRKTAFDFPGKAGILAADLIATDQPGEGAYLDTGDLAKLYNAKLTGRASDVRYMALFACLTGLRISDWSKFDLSAPRIEIDGVKFIRIVTQKTDVIAYPPLLPITEKILNIYGGPIPEYWRGLHPEAFRWEFNKALRSMAEQAGFTEQVEKIRRSKGKTITVTAPRHEFFSSKIGRKSFISNLRTCGAPDNLIAIMTGHKVERSILDTYDMRVFSERIPGAIRYLREYENKLPRDLDDWIISMGRRY